MKAEDQPVDGTPDDWRRAAAAIEERRDKLLLSKATLYKQSMSETTFRKMAEGVGVAKPENRVKIARALRWSDDSLDRLLRGEPPVEAAPAPAASSDALDEIRAMVSAIQKSVEVERAEAGRHGAAIARLADGLQQLLDAMPPPAVEAPRPTNAEH